MKGDGRNLWEPWVYAKLFYPRTEGWRPPIPLSFTGGHDMARIAITRPDGRPSPYFWTDKEPGDKALKTVYKQTADGVKRMKGVRFDVARSKIKRD